MAEGVRLRGPVIFNCPQVGRWVTATQKISAVVNPTILGSVQLRAATSSADAVRGSSPQQRAYARN